MRIHLPKTVNDKIRLSNMLSLLSLPLCLVSILIGVIIIDYGTIYSFVLTTVVFAAIPFLNSAGNHRVSRIALSTLPPLIILIPTIAVGQVTMGHVFAYSYAMLGCALIPIVLIDYETERKTLFSLMVFHILVVLFFDVLLVKYANAETQNLFWEMFVQVKIAQFILLAFILGVGLILISRNPKVDSDLGV